MKAMTKFKCILADPPWQFRDRGSRINPEYSGQYKTMTLRAIQELRGVLDRLASDNCHLWLCTPNALLLDGSALTIARYWGFVPKQILTWVKNRFGMGHWMRNQTEQIVLCTKGRLAPKNRNVPTFFKANVTRHSEKPMELYQHIECVSPGPYLDMFSRRAIDNWSSWGDQAPYETKIA